MQVAAVSQRSTANWFSRYDTSVEIAVQRLVMFMKGYGNGIFDTRHFFASFFVAFTIMCVKPPQAGNLELQPFYKWLDLIFLSVPRCDSSQLHEVNNKNVVSYYISIPFFN